MSVIIHLMYNDFYNFKENPFNITPDPQFFFSGARHLEAISHLLYGIDQRKGIILVTGEIGTGKTTICRTLLNKLNEKTKTALILNPTFSDTQLLQIILNDYGIASASKNKFTLVTTLNNFLLEQSNIGNNVVLIIDEGQNLSIHQLEQIRLLSNLETTKQKLLQIILVGQPELLEKLKLPALRQLNQRISVRFHLLPLTREELNDYIFHRMQIAQEDISAKGKVEFTDSAIDTIFKISEGTPRVINILCDRALLAGFTNDLRSIDKEIIHQCAKEVGK